VVALRMAEIGDRIEEGSRNRVAGLLNTKLSAPLPPVSRSAPAPPMTVSLPASPESVSFPHPPKSLSSPSPPESESAPHRAGQRIASVKS